VHCTARPGRRTHQAHRVPESRHQRVAVAHALISQHVVPSKQQPLQYARQKVGTGAPAAAAAAAPVPSSAPSGATATRRALPAIAMHTRSKAMWHAHVAPVATEPS